MLTQQECVDHIFTNGRKYKLNFQSSIVNCVQSQPFNEIINLNPFVLSQICFCSVFFFGILLKWWLCVPSFYDQVIQREPWEHIKDEDIRKAAASFKGEIWQVPPMFSAIKVHYPGI